MADEKAPSERTRVKRYHWLAKYDRQTVYDILDAMPMCSVGYVIDGLPYVTPTLQWREGDRIYWHGSSASRMLRAVDKHDVCITVSLIDGLVMARSAFNWNVNHRSVMLFGQAEKVTDPEAKAEHFKTMVNRWVPNQWDRLRPMQPQELKATSLMSMAIDEASCKVRSAMPDDEQADYDFPVWAGIVPVRYEIGEPIPDPRNLPGVELPDDVQRFTLG